MNNAYQILFSSNASYNFISVCNGNKYKIHILYDYANDMYFMDIDRYENSEYINIISGINLVTGFDLFNQFSHYNLGNLFVIPFTKDYYEDIPRAKTIKNKFFLLWIHN